MLVLLKDTNECRGRSQICTCVATAVLIVCCMFKKRLFLHVPPGNTDSTNCVLIRFYKNERKKERKSRILNAIFDQVFSFVLQKEIALKALFCCSRNFSSATRLIVSSSA